MATSGSRPRPVPSAQLKAWAALAETEARAIGPADPAGRRHNFEAVSLLIEEATGADSIPTIELHQFCDGYRHDDKESCQQYHCVMPGCSFTSAGSQTMWLHEHWGDAHQPSFEFTIRQLINALPDWPRSKARNS